MWVAVDVMSGDYGPVELIKGSVYAVNEYGCSVVLVGDEEQISEILLGYEYNSDKIIAFSVLKSKPLKQNLAISTSFDDKHK